MSVGEFHRSLRSRGVGAKDWSNSWTEHEYLGVDEKGRHKFAASLSVGHRVFKHDGTWHKHILEDKRPDKDFILVRSAKCVVEVYPFYAKYYDVDYTETRLHEERWVVQRLFKAPDEWRDVDAYNPVMSVEETENGIIVTVSYTTDYGSLVVKYIQRDGSALKHEINFTNTSGSAETFRVLQRWAGIVGEKCNGKDFPLEIMGREAAYLAFHSSDKPARNFNIAENLWSMMFNPDGSVKMEKCLVGPIRIEGHAQGMKTDFIYTRWTLAQGESLTIDPDTATLNNPTQDGWVEKCGTDAAECLASAPARDTSAIYITYGGYKESADADSIGYRGYVEWPIGILAGATLTANPIFKYDGYFNGEAYNQVINPILEEQPSSGGCTDLELWGYIATGVAYVDPFNLVEGVNQSQDLGAAAKADLQTAMNAAQSWFAIGFQADLECPPSTGGWNDGFYSEEQPGVTPPPTLYVEYSVGGPGGAGAVVMGTKSLILDLLLEGVI